MHRFALDPDVVHLNHGGFGGCPRTVLAAASAIRERMEASPTRFFELDWQRELDAARHALAQFVRAPDDRLVFVPNATTGVAIALATAAERLNAGDEIIATDHAYAACKNQLVRHAAARGAHIRIQTLPLPFDPDAAVDAITAAITPKTKLALLDHVTSPTGLVMPLERIVPALAARDIAIAIDGAHAPGQLPLDIGNLLAAGVTWYAGNNHKWLCAVKSSGFLVTTTPLHPVVTSHGASPEYGPPNRLHAEFDWAGTHDPSPHLAVPVAIAEVARLGDGWPAVWARNHALAVAMRRMLVDAGASVLAPDSSLGAMATVPIDVAAPEVLQRQLLAAGWEVAIMPRATGPLLRVSAHLYNRLEHIDGLLGQLRAFGVALR